ncbi:MAG TPA: hypothetical protein VGL65_05645 [Gemmatimonadales bacterium]
MRPADPVRASLDAIARPLGAMLGLVRLLAGAAAAVLIFAVVAWIYRINAAAAPEWVLAAWTFGIVLIVAGVFISRRAMRRIDAREVGHRLEAQGAWRRGALTTLLDPPVIGTSPALHAAATAARAEEIRRRGGAALESTVDLQRRQGRRAAGLAALLLIGLAAARPATGAPARLWHPVDAWRALVTPIRLTARRASVARGEPAVFDVLAIGADRVELLTRAPGEEWHTAVVALDHDGRATIVTPPLTAEIVARAEGDGHRSVDVRVGITLAAFLGAFVVTAHYPGYLGLDDEVLPTTGDTLVIPQGTALGITGRATAPLANARLVGEAGDVALSVAGNGFRGELRPARSTTWHLQVSPAKGGSLAGEMPALPIRIVDDSAPHVEIPVPGVDTVATMSMSLPLIVGIRDDHGIVSAGIETRSGHSTTVVRTPLSLPPGGGDRALVTTALDLAALGLTGGDTLRYTAFAIDNAPTHQVGRSREFLVRVPTAAELRAMQARQTSETATAFDSLSNQAGRVQRTEEDLARERQRTTTGTSNSAADNTGPKAPLASDAARKADAAAQTQQKVIDDATRLQQSLRELRDASQRSGVADSAITRELNEIDQLLDQALSSELRDNLAALRDALKRLDADQTRDALQNLAQQQAQLKSALDQARDLFKRAALETQLANLGRDAGQLASDQHDLTPKLAQRDSGAASRAERDLARRADSVAAGLDRAAAQVPAPDTRAGLQGEARQARGASDKMRQAAQSSDKGQSADAQSQAQQAEDDLKPLSKKIDEDRKNMQAEMRADVTAALTRALEETGRLAQRQLAVVRALQEGALLPGTRTEQGVVAEGAGKVLQQVIAIGAMNALVSPQAGVALAQARRSMQDAIDAVSTVSPNVRVASDAAGDAVDALAVAAFAMMQSKDRVNGSQSGSGLPEAMAQIQQMAGKQGQLAQQSAGMMQGGGGFSTQQLMQLALQQRALAQQLERMQAGGQLPGAGALAREATDLARALETGSLNPSVVERQQALFKRMLDAGRSLQGDEDDVNKQRQATTAKDAPPAIPPALDPRIRNGTGEIRLPSWESLQRLSPDERRRVLDYFQRLTSGPQP